MTATANSQVPHELFTLDSLASAFIESWNQGKDLPRSQKEKLLANQTFYDVVENKSELNVPNAIFRRLQLVWLCNILDKSLWNNELGVLNDAYRIFKGMEFPPELEYSDEFLDVLVDFKTQLLLGNLMQNSYIYTDALNSFVRKLKILDRDEAKAEIINKKWIAKCNRRKKDIDLFGSFDQMVKAWPESQFLEKMKSLLMRTGAYLNQKYPASMIRRKWKTGTLEEKVYNVDESSSSAKTSSIALTDDHSIQLHTIRKLPKSFEKRNAYPVDVNKELDSPRSASTDALNQYISNTELNGVAQESSQIRSGTVPLSEYLTAFEGLKSLYTLDHSDLLHDREQSGSIDLNEASVKEELVNLKKKIEVVYDGYSRLRKFLNLLKDEQRKLEKLLPSIGLVSNELPWTDDEENMSQHADKNSPQEFNFLDTKQNAHENDSSDKDHTDTDDDYKLSKSQQISYEDNNMEDNVLQVSEEEGELVDDEDEDSNDNTHHFRHHLSRLIPSSPSSRSRRTPKKTHCAEIDSYKVQLAAYDGKEVYEIKCKNVWVLRRVSDGWVNASTIVQASSRDDVLKVMIEEGLPEPKESFKGSKSSKLQGIWYYLRTKINRVPVETAEKLASYLDLEKELSPLFADDIIISSVYDISELAYKRQRAEDTAGDTLLKTRKSSKSIKNKTNASNLIDRRAKGNGSQVGGNLRPLRKPKRSSRSKGTEAPKIESPEVQLVAYNGKDVYEVKCNNVIVLRRVSDGWVNATTIFEASGLGSTQIAAINATIPEPKEIMASKKLSKLHGMWVPVETAKKIAHSCKLEKELFPLLTYSV